MAGNIVFRTLNRIHIFLYRSTGGRILDRVVGSPLLVLTTTGRKTGRSRTVPLVYTMQGSQYAVIATDNPGWYHNLKSSGRASIEVKGQIIPVTVRDVPDAEISQWWERIIAQSPAFKPFRDSPHHQIVILEPA